MAKRSVFTAAQNAALRAALAGLEYPSHSAAAVDLGIQQQNVSRLLGDERAGFGYDTACRVARLAGFGGLDEFFAAHGVEAEAADVPAQRLGARAGVAQG